MRATSLMRSVRAFLALLVVGATGATSVVAAKPVKPSRPRAMNLFSSAGYLFEVNRQQCGLLNTGVVCAAFAGSPVGGGGFWPKGTPDQYIFWSGLQMAGIVSRTSGFAWAGDTSGAYFVDFRGDQQAGNPLSLIYSRLVPQDVAAWNTTPPTKTVLDTSIYNPVLIGSDAISQGDVFVRYWEGDPVALTGREHPMGIAVDQRVLAWNFPSGNEDIIYIIYTFYNITARSSSGKYNNSTIPGPLQAEIAAIGDQFQDINENKFKIQIPDGGYTIDSLYAAAAMDADVAVFSQNYATAIVPFNLGLEYTGTFLGDVGWQFPPDIFGPPFAAATGFIGMKFLKSPKDATGKQVGLTMFSQEINGSTGLPDAVGVRQLYRYLSGSVGPTDNPCNPSAPGPVVRARRYCFLGQFQADARFFQASGPFSLPPGEARTIVVAYINAAPYNGTGTPLVNKGANADTKPGTGGVGLTGLPTDSIRLIDKIVGWVSSNDANGDGKISQEEVTTVPGSLLAKSLVAQAVFDKGFLLPSAPDAPDFFLVPGDDQVTVVWQTSRSEITGDPFFATASQPLNPGGSANTLYDPNFRKFDVEGYRVYRGRTSSTLQLIAQFDYAGTSFIDRTGQIDYGDRNGDGLTQCAPELGLTATPKTGGDCPVAFQTTSPFAIADTVPLAGPIVQVANMEAGGLKAGNRVQLVSGNVLNLKADTAVTTQLCGVDASGGVPVKCPGLKDTGVPFVFVDAGVRNSFTFFYAVTAFDLNSASSGPTSLESPRVTKRVTPRKVGTSAVTAAGPVTFTLVDGKGNALNPSAAAPTIDATAGTFSGPAVPTGAFEGLGMQLFAGLSLKANSAATIRIDSVVPQWYHTAFYYFSGIGPVTVASKFGPDGPLGEEDGTATLGPASAPLPADTTVARSQGLGALPFAGQQLGQVRLNAVTFTSKDADWHPQVDGANFAPTGITNVGGSRWFDGANETLANPTLGDAHGQLIGVTTIFRPVRAHSGVPALFRRFDQTTYHLFRAADIKIYWGTTPGKPDSVVDVTHHVPVPFDPQNRASYGFLRDVAGTDTTGKPSTPDGLITYVDFFAGACLPGASGITNTDCETRGYASTATLGPVDVTGDLVSDGQGFGMYINGEPFLFLTSALPAKPAVWTYRSYMGLVARSGTTYSFTVKPSNPPVPGLGLHVVTSTPSALDLTGTADLSRVHTVPDPYYVANALEITANQKVLKFVNLPARCIIRIYSVSGVLVGVIPFDDPTGGGEATWNLRNRNNQFVASGVYFYHIETPGGQTKIGRFTVVNFAP